MGWLPTALFKPCFATHHSRTASVTAYFFCFPTKRRLVMSRVMKQTTV